MLRGTFVRFLGFAFSLALLLLVSKGAAYIKDYYVSVIVTCGIYVILAVSLNLINGITGQFSIGHAGFYAVGAYVGASWSLLALPRIADTPLLKIGTPVGDTINVIIAIILGAGAAALAGFVVGIPSLRLRGDYLAIVTLGFGEVIRVIFLNMDAVGAARGLTGIPSIVSNHDMSIFWVYGVAILVIMLSKNLIGSVRGLSFLAVREDEIAADAMGVNTTRVKVTAFVLGSAFAGAAGSLYAHFATGISPDVFDMNTSIIITTMVVLGGTGSITGSVLAAIMLTALPEWLRFLQDYRMVIFSTTLIVMMLTRPQGIFGHREISFASFKRRKRAVIGGGEAP